MSNEKETGAQGEIGGPAAQGASGGADAPDVVFPGLRVGDWVRIRKTVCDGPHECEDGPGTDPSMFRWIGQEVRLERSPDTRWPLYAKSFFWLPQWLETLDGVPLSPERAALPTPKGEGPDLEALVKELVGALKAMVEYYGYATFGPIEAARKAIAKAEAAFQKAEASL